MTGPDDLDPPARQAWAAGRVWSATHAPYLASAVLALEPVVVKDIPADLSAFPTDPRWHVYLDADVVAQAPVPTIGFWLLHQVTHLLRHHADRCRDAGPRLWNVASDAEIDDDLHAESLQIPENAVTPARLALPDGWLAEQYYEALTRTRPDTRQPDQVEGRGEAGPKQDSSAVPGPVHRTGGPPSGSADCSGADGHARPYEIGGGRSALELRLLELDVAHRIREHTRTRGDMPAGWRRWADGVLEPVVDWRHVLRSAVRRGVADVVGRVDFSYRRPSRRAGSSPGVVLPSLRQPLARVAVIIDTSGSMSEAMLAQVLGEIRGLLAGLGIGRTHLRVLCCDAQAHQAQRVFDAASVQLLGGGGTDMGAGLRAVAEMRPNPDVVVVLTDGHTPWSADNPVRGRVIVALLDPTGTAPGWATVVPVPAPTGTKL